MKKLLFILLLLPLFAMPQAVKRHREIIIDSLSALTDGIIDVKDTLNLEAPLKAINIIFDSSIETDILTDVNSGAYIQLNAYGDNDITITTDSGAFGDAGGYFSSSQVSLFVDNFDRAVNLGTSNEINIINNVDGGDITMGLNAGIQYGGEIVLINNSLATVGNNGSYDSKALFLGTKNSDFDSGIINSVIIGGNNITATQNNTAYVQNLTAKENIICDTIFSDAINIYSVSDTIDSAAISILNGTPVQIVAAPGSGKMIEVISVSNKIIFNSIAWDTNTTLRIIINTAQAAQITDADILRSTGSRIIRGSMGIAGLSTTDTQIVENQALMIDVITGNPANGDSDIIYYVTYQIITL